METSTLRLVIDLYPDDAGSPQVVIRRCDRPVEYGPVRVQDLHYLIEALLPAEEAAMLAPTRP
jgi:hypothetical protein